MTITIQKDEYEIYDELLQYRRKHNIFGPVGWVRAFLDDQLVVDKPNLVVAQGREFVAMRTFGINQTDDGTTLNDYTGYTIQYFGIGKGGSTVDASDNVSFLGPNVCDTHLYDPIPLSDSDTTYKTEPSGVDYVLKPITMDGSIYLEPGGLCSPDYYTKVKCTCNIIAGEPSTLQPGNSIKIDEAALYFSVDGSVNRIFSHICFAPKWKEKESEFTLLWYILY